MFLTSEHVALLRQLAEKRRVAWGALPGGGQELADAGLCLVTPAGASELQMEITDAGRRALEKADRPGTKTMGSEDLNASNDE